jgi:hypothetical protein
MSKIILELDEQYKESLDILKQALPIENWETLDNDSKVVEALIDTFIQFIKSQSESHEGCGDWGCWGH